MSLLLRCLCATLVLLVAIHCSQEFSIGNGNEIAADTPLQDENWDTEITKVKRLTSGDIETRDSGMEVSEEDEGLEENAEKRNEYFRIGRGPYLRVGKRSLADEYLTQSVVPQETYDKTFLRIGRAPSDSTFLRIGRADTDKSFLRIGRDTEKVSDRLLAEDTEDMVSDGDDEQNMEKRFPLRIGKRRLRIGKRVLERGNQNSELTPDEIQLLQENKDLLLQLLQLHPELLNDDKYLKNGKEDNWSFYFPRMGRSGEEESNSGGYCCEEGVRSVVTMGQNTLKACPSEQGCCPGLSEKTKLYKDIIITECAAESGIDKIRALIGDK